MIASTQPREELELFKQLKRLRVIFDVGARTDVEYLSLLPNATFHLFEPNPDFYEELKEKVWKIRKGKGIYLNQYGLGDKSGVVSYNTTNQACCGGDQGEFEGHYEVNLQTLKDYCARQGVERIDFLKIDTEGYDFKVLSGGLGLLPKIRYIQYEYWNNPIKLRELLGDWFEMENIGYRNVLAMNKNLVPQAERKRLKQYILDKELAGLA